MISGYFGIRHTWQKLLTLFIDVVAYGCVAYLLTLLLSPVPFSWRTLLGNLDFRHYWFVTHYVLLVMLAPALETLLSGQNSKTIGKWVLVLLVVNVLFGWFWDIVNFDGYNYLNFIMIYVIARFVRLIKTEGTRLYQHVSKYGLAYYALASIALALGMFLLSEIGRTPASMHYFGYNNPILLFSCFCLFTWFSDKGFKSGIINIVATGMFGVYLIHTSSALEKVWPTIPSVAYVDYGYIAILFSSVFLFAILSVISVVVEQGTSALCRRICAFFRA